VVDGIRFDSKAEAQRYCDLLSLQAAEMISDLSLQPQFNLVVNGKHICAYRGDFLYSELRNGVWSPVVEDVKGVSTQAFVIKRKLFEACYPDIALVITKRKR
jgi:hypothetical protein